MKKFKFNLQRLLDIREAKEKEVKNELARILTIQNREKTVQEEYRRNIETQQRRFTEKIRTGGYSFNEAMMFERYVDFAHRVIRNQQDKIDAMEPEIGRIRQRLVEASRQKKVVEKLKERKWGEFQYEYGREMAKENDDMNQKLYQRHMATEA